MGPPVKGHTGKADNASLTPQKGESQSFLQREPNLLWLTGTLHGQQIPMMLDSGATVCCLAKRCFTGSPYLQNLPLQGYTGPGLLDANGQIMKPFGVIKAPLVVGHPAVSHTVEFMIIDALPYSCILGLSFLNKFTKWGIDNSKKLLHLDQSVVLVSSQPSLQDNIAFITPNKYTILPGQSLTIKTVANGPSLHAFRPVSELTALIDGHAPFEERLHVKVVPYLHKVSHQHSCVPTVLVNTSAVAKTIKKGTKVALGTYDFEEFSVLPKDTINLLSTQDTDNSAQTSDPITILT